MSTVQVADAKRPGYTPGGDRLEVRRCSGWARPGYRQALECSGAHPPLGRHLCHRPSHLPSPCSGPGTWRSGLRSSRCLGRVTGVVPRVADAVMPHPTPHSLSVDLPFACSYSLWPADGFPPPGPASVLCVSPSLSSWPS